MAYIIRVIDRKTGQVVQEEIRKSFTAADRLYCLALRNVNPLIYRLQFEEIATQPGRREEQLPQR